MVLDRSCALQQAKSFCNTICQKATFTLQQNFLFDRRAERSGAGESFTRAARLEPHVRKNAASPVQFVAGKTHVRMKRSVVSVPAVDAERGGAIMLKRTHCAPCAAPSQAAVAQGSGDLMPHRAFTAHRGALLCATALAGTMVFAALAVPPLPPAEVADVGRRCRRRRRRPTHRRRHRPAQAWPRARRTPSCPRARWRTAMRRDER